jgi:hypothetical protein
MNDIIMINKAKKDFLFQNVWSQSAYSKKYGGVNIHAQIINKKKTFNKTYCGKKITQVWEGGEIENDITVISCKSCLSVINNR